MEKSIVGEEHAVLNMLVEAGIEVFKLGTPIGRLVLKAVVIGKNIYDARMTKKVCEFLDNLGCDDEKMRNKLERFFCKRVYGTKNEQRNGELLLEYIDHIEDIRHAGLIGRILSYFGKMGEEVDVERFFKTVFLIKNAFYPDLECLKLFENNQYQTQDENVLVSSDDERLDNVFTYGLLDNCGFCGGDAAENRAGTRYALNDYGRITLKCLELKPKGKDEKCRI